MSEIADMGLVGGVHLHAVSVREFSAYRRTHSDKGVDYIYVGTRCRHSSGAQCPFNVIVEKCLMIPHKHGARLTSNFNYNLNYNFIKAYIKIKEKIAKAENTGLKHFFIVCDEDEMCCAYFLLLEFVKRSFNGEKLSELEMNMVEALKAVHREKAKYADSVIHSQKYSFHRELWTYDDTVIIIEQNDTARGIALVYINERTGITFIFPHLSEEIIMEVIAEAIAKI